MNSVDIGTIKDVNLDFCNNLNDDDKVQGKYKELCEVLLNLAELYLAMQQTSTVKLNWFNHHVFKVMALHSVKLWGGPLSNSTLL